MINLVVLLYWMVLVVLVHVYLVVPGTTVCGTRYQSNLVAVLKLTPPTAEIVVIRRRTFNIYKKKVQSFEYLC